VTLGPAQIAIVFGYLAFILFKGVRRSGDISGEEDFLLAGRNVTWPVLLCTMSATVIGGRVRRDRYGVRI